MKTRENILKILSLIFRNERIFTSLFGWTSLTITPILSSFAAIDQQANPDESFLSFNYLFLQLNN
jgi:hypothetical protein